MKWRRKYFDWKIPVRFGAHFFIKSVVSCEAYHLVESVENEWFGQCVLINVFVEDCVINVRACNRTNEL